MSQQSPSATTSTWGMFSTQSTATMVKSQLGEAGIAPENITLEAQNFQTPLELQDTQAIENAKFGAIAGALMGFLMGLTIVLLATNFFSIGVAAFKSFQAIHYLAPFIGALVGAAAMSLISGITGTNVPKSRTKTRDREEPTKYVVTVRGTIEEIDLAREIMAQQDDIVTTADKK